MDILNAICQQTAEPGQPFELTEITVRGQQLRAWKNAPATLRDLWLSTEAHAANDYIVYGDERLSYAEAHAIVIRIAGWLKDNGIEQGDRVAIAMRNYPEWILAYWAITAMGCVAVGMNAWWVAEEMDYALEDSGARVLIADAERLARFNEIRDRFEHIKVVSVRCDEPPAWTTAWDQIQPAGSLLPHVDIDPDDDACVFYTSGTTGRPKGAQLTHRGCTQNAFSMVFLSFTQSLAIAKRHNDPTMDPTSGLAPSPAALLATPLFHVTANNCGAQPTTLMGGKLVLMYKWDAGEALRLIEQERIRTLSTVPAMARDMVMHPDFGKRDLSTVQSLGGGGAAVQPDLVKRIDARGYRPSQGYGMTETCGIISASIGDFLAEKPESCGMIVPIYDARVVDEAGVPQPAGAVGELCVRGPQVIKGYLNRPEATADTIDGGWLRTGDIARIDEDNFLYLIDRAKDMVLRGGENVYCSEVENALFHFDGVREAAVFSVPDERLGEEVGAAIYCENGTVDVNELRAHCRQHIAAFKVPRYIWLTDQPLPRNANGKFLKRELRETLAIEDAI